MINPEFIYDLGNGKYARGRAAERATWVVQRTTGVGFPVYKGVQARKPLIPADAPKLSRRAAGKALTRALGLQIW